ncbi:MAG TPA: hypothetical protein VFA86_04710 [Gammaproteobacteria bacterium]|nr:hypothetical protein [Gammaproteobacteria bacterium]
MRVVDLSHPTGSGGWGVGMRVGSGQASVRAGDARGKWLSAGLGCLGVLDLNSSATGSPASCSASPARTPTSSR